MKKTKNIIALVLALVLGVFSLTACSKTDDSTASGTPTATTSSAGTSSAAASSTGTPSTETASSVQLKTVRIGAATSGGRLIGLDGVAQIKGFYDEELAKVGYIPEFTAYSNGPVLNEAYVSGRVDIGLLGLLPALTLRASGADVQLFVSGTVQGSPFALGVQPDSTATSLKDLVGKMIVTGKGTALETFFLQQAATEGLTADDFVFANDATAFYTGDADAITQMYIQLYTDELAGKAKILLSTLDNLTSDFGYGYVGTDYLKENPAVIGAIIKAKLRSIDYAAAYPDETYEILVETYSNSYPIEVIKSIFAHDPLFKNYAGPVRADTDKALHSVQAVLDSMFTAGQITEELDVNTFADTEDYNTAFDEYVKETAK